jgi:hypothetical protein
MRPNPLMPTLIAIKCSPVCSATLAGKNEMNVEKNLRSGSSDDRTRKVN